MRYYLKGDLLSHFIVEATPCGAYASERILEYWSVGCKN
jgi:hypothetical protein